MQGHTTIVPDIEFQHFRHDVILQGYRFVEMKHRQTLYQLQVINSRMKWKFFLTNNNYQTELNSNLPSSLTSLRDVIRMNNCMQLIQNIPNIIDKHRSLSFSYLRL